MKKLLFTLIIALSVISCKKERLQNCLIGKWQHSNINSTQYIEFTKDKIIMNGSGKSFMIGTVDYYISKDFDIISNGRNIGHAECNGNTLKFTSETEPTVIAYNRIN